MDFHKALGELERLGQAQADLDKSVINLIASDSVWDRNADTFPIYDGHIIQEGLAGRRPFAGATIHDHVERLAGEIACDIFEAGHANLQPHSCSQANQAVYQGLLQPGSRILSLAFTSGGHLTHGHHLNFSGSVYSVEFFHTDAAGLIDYDQAAQLARSFLPDLIVCGASSYPRVYDVERLRRIADDSDCLLMLDLSHEAGLIAAGALPNPVPSADVVTMSLDKTLRGPFGGMILCDERLASRIDRGVHPGTQSSFPIRRLFDSAQALLRTTEPTFKAYAERTLENAQIFAEALGTAGIPVITGGTDKHYVIADVRSTLGLGGVAAEHRLERHGILTNRQTVPSDSDSVQAKASGLRFGTSWISGRGYSAEDTTTLIEIVISILSRATDDPDPELVASIAALAGRPRPADGWPQSVD